MAAPVWQATGTFQSGGAVQLTVPWPTHQADDIAILVVSSAGTIPTLATAAGFVEMPDSPQVTTALNTGIYWCRATSGAMASPVTGTGVNNISGVIVTFRGCITTGDPWDVTSGSVKGVTSTATSIPGDTTTLDECVIAYIAGRGSDFTNGQWSGEADSTVTGLTERVDLGTSSGNGGGIGFWTGTKATAGAYGPMTATLLNTSLETYNSVALKPPAAGATVTPAVVATVTTVPTPTVLAASNVTPAVVAATVTVPTPTVMAASNVTPAVVAATTTVPTPTVTAAANVTPAVVAATVTVPTPTTDIGDTVVTPAVVAATTTVSTPTVTAGAVVTPAVVALTTTVPNPTVAGEGIGNPATVAVVSTVPTPTIIAGGVVTPAVVVTAVTVPTPTVQAQATVTPAVVATTVTVPTPAVLGGSGVFPATVTATVTVPTPTILSGAHPVPAVIPMTTTVPTPTIQSGPIVVIALPATGTISDADHDGAIQDRNRQAVLSSGGRTGTIR